MTARFSVIPTIDGYDVIDGETGHPVDHRDTPRSANGVAFFLNDAAAHGSLQGALLRGNPSDPCDPASIRAEFSAPFLGDAPDSLRSQSRRELSEDHESSRLCW